MKKTKIIKGLVIAAAVLAALAVASLAAVHILAGRAPRWSGSKSFLLSFTRSTLGSGSVKSTSHGNYTNIIFLHQSTGRNLIDQGSVRTLFQQAGFAFWDHDYNDVGLRDPNGAFKGYGYNVPGDNTYPDGLSAIFKQPAYPLPFNTFSGLMQHEVIILKSCFPTSNIPDEQSLARLKNYYLEIRSRMDRYPDKVFILLTQPPLIPSETSLAASSRARALADWLKSSEFRSGHPNIFVYDFFNALAEPDPSSADYNTLRAAYRNGSDSHPNQAANEAIGPQFVQFALGSIQAYRSNSAKP